MQDNPLMQSLQKSVFILQKNIFIGTPVHCLPPSWSQDLEVHGKVKNVQIA